MASWDVTEIQPGLRELKLSGDWGVDKAGDLHKAFTQALDGAKRVRIDMADLGSVDLSFFQVLYSARKTFDGGEITAENVPDALAARAEAMGFNPKHVSDAFWKGVVHGQAHHDRG